MRKINFSWILLLALASVVMLSGCINQTQPNKTAVEQNNQTESQTPASSAVDTDHDGIPDSAEKVLGTDPMNPDTDGDGIKDKQDANPVKVGVQFLPSTGPQGFAIKEVLVENNYDREAKKVAPDHLEIILKNLNGSDISNFTVYYTITDLKTKQEESYVKALPGFTLKGHGTKSIHIDSGRKPGHFRANPSSMYYASTDGLEFNVTVSAQGYQAQTASVKKDAGGAEVAD